MNNIQINTSVTLSTGAKIVLTKEQEEKIKSLVKEIVFSGVTPTATKKKYTKQHGLKANKHWNTRELDRLTEVIKEARDSTKSRRSFQKALAKELGRSESAISNKWHDMLDNNTPQPSNFSIPVKQLL